MTRGITQGEFWFPDASRHAMDGVFVLDFIKDFPLFHIVDYTIQYYTKYPALGIGYYPPFFAIVEALFFGLFGISVFSARLTVVFFAVIAVIFWFKLIKLVYDEKTAFYSSLLFISTPFIVKWSRSVMLEMPALAMIILAIYCFYNFVEHSKKRYGYYLVFSIAAAILTKQTAVFLIPFFVLYVIFTKKFKRLFSRNSLLISLVLSSLVLVLVLFTLKMGGMNLYQSIGSLTEHDRLMNAARWGFYPKALIKVLTLPVLILSIVSIGLLFLKKEFNESILFLSWLIGFYIVFTYIAAQETRYAYFWIPPFVLFATLLINRVPWKIKGFSLVPVFVLFLSLYQIYLSVNQEIPYVKGFEEAARYISEKPGQTVFFQGSPRGNGNFIFHARQFDEAKEMVVLRGDKVLASSAVSPYRSLVEHVKTKEEVYDALTAYGSKYFLVEKNADFNINAFRMLRDVLRSEDFTLVKKINIATDNNNLEGVFTQPANGVVTALDHGNFIYTPAPGFTGMDIFEYQVTGKGGLSVSAPVIIFVLDHSNPVAVNDMSATTINTPVTIDFLHNDRGGSWSGFSFTQPANGRVSVGERKGALIYNPAPGFTGKDSFTYTLIDMDGVPYTAPVEVLVLNNTDPYAVEDICVTPMDTPVTIDALYNDRPDWIKGRLVRESFTQPANGKVISLDHGTYVYTPAPNFTGKDAFEYTITGGGISVSASVSVLVLDHTEPVAVGDISVTTVNRPITIYMLSNDRKGSWVDIDFAQPANGTVSLVKGGRALVYTPNPGFIGIDSFSYTAIDENGTPYGASVAVFVVDHSDPVAVDDVFVTSADTPVTVYTLENDRPDWLKGQSILVYKLNKESAMKRDRMNMRLPIIGSEITVPLKTLFDFYTPSNSVLSRSSSSEEPVSD